MHLSAIDVLGSAIWKAEWLQLLELEPSEYSVLEFCQFRLRHYSISHNIWTRSSWASLFWRFRHSFIVDSYDTFTHGVQVWVISIGEVIWILNHWGRLTHMRPDNGLSPGRRQAIIWTNVGILLIGPLGTKFSGIIIEIYIFSFKQMHLKLSPGNRRQFCLGLNVFKHHWCRYERYG